MRTVLFLFFSLAFLQIQAQCPDCEPDLECVGDGTFPLICPLVFPDATANEYYETVLTFNLPPNIVDPETEVEVELQQITVTGVSGLPFGLTYTINVEGGTYFPSQGDEYGCATVCGTPLIPGDYDVIISVNVTVIAFGFEQVLDESFSLPLTVLPGESTNSSFTYDNLFGCGSAEVNFDALIDGSPGITTYDWDFGNGNIGNQATPPTQTYSDEGDYTVTLTTTIEDYTLNAVAISNLASGWGGDVEELSEALFSPDPYFVITDGNGIDVFTSDAIVDSETGNWNGLNVILNNPPYTLSVYDQDNGGLFGSDDDFLGSSQITVAEGVADLNAGDSSGSITIGLQVSNVFEDSEVVTVFPTPNAEFIYLEADGVLDYDDDLLNYFTWTLFGDTIQEGPQDSLLLIGPGIYQCAVQSVFGCEATSEIFTLCPEVELTLLPLIDLITADEGFASYQWFFNGLPVDGATDSSIDSSEPGNYALTVTTDYGCEVSSEVLTITVGIAEANQASWSMYPNPSQGMLSLQFEVPSGELTVFDLGGKVCAQFPVNTLTKRLDLSFLRPGTYQLTWKNEGIVKTQKLVLTR